MTAMGLNIWLGRIHRIYGFSSFKFCDLPNSLKSREDFMSATKNGYLVRVAREKQPAGDRKSVWQLSQKAMRCAV